MVFGKLSSRHATAFLKKLVKNYVRKYLDVRTMVAKSELLVCSLINDYIDYK